MNVGVVVALSSAALLAVADWVAVHRERRAVEYVCKPAVMVAVLVAAVAIDPTDDAQRAWFIAAFACSLAGDVFLMLPDERFVPGLASFLLGHVAFVAGFFVRGIEGPWLAFGVGVVAVLLAVLSRPVVGGVRRDDVGLLLPVVAYMAVISAMVVAAFGTAVALAIAGALTFYVSDALIAWNRFVRSHGHGRLAIMVTYHVAQVLLVVSLVA